MKDVAKYAPLIFSLLLAFFPKLEVVSAFLAFSTPRFWQGHRYDFIRPLARKEASPKAAATNTTNNQARLESVDDIARLPVRQQVLKIQNRLEEIHDLNKRGEKLTQDYCDTALALCVAADEWESVLDILEIMKAQNLSQEHSTYRACLQYCFEMGNGASAEEILQAMSKALVVPEPSDIGLVAAAMCRNNKREPGYWKKALDLVMSNPSPDIPVEAYDAVLSCMVDESKWKEAIRLLREMEQGSSSKIKRIHPEPTLATYREVIECCVASNQAEQAVQVLRSMTDRGINPTVYTFELVISALAKKLQWRRAIQLLDLMGELEVPKTVLTYNTIIKACTNSREVGVAKNLLSRMRKEGIKPSIVTYNSLISACASSRRWKDAMNILDQCNRDPNTVPDIYTYTNALRACAKSGKTERALTLYEVVKHKKLPLDSYFYAAVIEACAKAKLWRKAIEFLEEMEEEEGIAPTEVIYSLTITACGNGGKWQKALELLDQMRDRGMRISLITYNSAIAALAKAAKELSKRQAPMSNHRLVQNGRKERGNKEELWKKAMELLKKMQEDGISPDGFSYSSAISCCGAEGQWEEALKMVEVMRQGGPRTRPNKVAYTAAITACGKSGKYEYSLKLFREMIDEGLGADRVAFNSLFNALRIAKKPDIAYELWSEMCGSKESNNTSKAAAINSKWATPDIVTVTDLIATLSSSGNDSGYKTKVDEVFAQAVERGIVFPKDTLDSFWEVDLSGMSFSVARAACRYILYRAKNSLGKNDEVSDLCFITGVGVASREIKQRNTNSAGRTGNNSGLHKEKDNRISLRDYVQRVLQEDFNPPIQSSIPKRAQGTVQIDKSELKEWIRGGK